MSEIQTVVPGDEIYEKIDSTLKWQQAERIDYAELAIQYNQAPENSILLIKADPRVKLGNLARVLSGRGLLRESDYLLYRVKRSASGTLLPIVDRPIALKRLSTAPMH